MRRPDNRETAVIRMLIGAIGSAEAEIDTGTAPRVGLGNEVRRRPLDAVQIDESLRSEHRAFLDAAAQYDQVGRPVDAAELRARAAIVEGYLA